MCTMTETIDSENEKWWKWKTIECYNDKIQKSEKKVRNEACEKINDENDNNTDDTFTFVFTLRFRIYTCLDLIWQMEN